MANKSIVRSGYSAVISWKAPVFKAHSCLSLKLRDCSSASIFDIPGIWAASAATRSSIDSVTLSSLSGERSLNSAGSLIAKMFSFIFFISWRRAANIEPVDVGPGVLSSLKSSSSLGPSTSAMRKAGNRLTSTTLKCE